MAADRCANCNATLVGPYCHECGQAAADPLRSFRAFVTDSLGDVVHLRTGTLLTLRTLFKPGRLTREYLDGRRARYVGPFQVYLLAAAVFFLASTLRPVIEFDLESRRIHSSLGIMSAGATLNDQDVASYTDRGVTMPLFKERFANHTNATLPIFLIISVALFVLLIRLIYIRQPHTIVTHAVFSLHWSAFFLLLMVLHRLIPQEDVARAFMIILSLVSLAYLAAALKHVYRQSWTVTVIKALTTFIIFNATLALWVSAVVFFAMESI